MPVKCTGPAQEESQVLKKYTEPLKKKVTMLAKMLPHSKKEKPSPSITRTPLTAISK
ncbi:hypothetical protein SAMN02787079_04520 [Lysinibacillus sp. TC-37]|nr:hypothetical protein SAMN02787078_04490 [Lysinibacillus sp. SG9]SDB57137.1 hypothetical protein SAMN02787079_04520 [Lysinibacillus sp. TC-37]SFT20714.1 hypothetical protein SAMN02787087_04480 [Lysinibacillus sp. SG55]